MASATARRFRADCPAFAQIDDDHFQQRLDRVAMWIDELGADAAAIAKLSEGSENYIGAWGAIASGPGDVLQGGLAPPMRPRK